VAQPQASTTASVAGATGAKQMLKRVEPIISSP
jgi:hypothetical protein